MRLSRRRLHRVASLMVQVAATAVPRPRREEWLRVWHGELWHALLWRAQDDSIDMRKGVGVLLRSLGAFPHAVHERRVEGIMGGWIQDLRFGSRVLTRRPGWTLLAAATLAVATGATTAMFAVVDGVLLRPLPYRQPGRLVAVQATFEGESGTSTRDQVSLPAYDQFLSSQDVVAPLAAYSAAGLVLDLGDGAELVPGAWVSANFFDALEVGPVAGRTFAAGEDQPGSPPLAIVSNRFWQNRLGGDPAVVGGTLRVGGRPVSVVGVVRDVELPSPTTDIWMAQGSFPRAASFHSHRLVGRLREGLALAGAQPALAAATGEIPVAPGVLGALHLRAEPLREALVGDTRPTLLALAAATLLLLAIAGVNLASLHRVRTGERSEEIAVRVAMGASRGRLRRQVTLESGMLALVGAFPGLLLADALVRLVLTLSGAILPRSWEVRVDPGVALFALGVAALTTLAAAQAAARPGQDTGAALRDAGARSRGGRRGRRAGDALVALQVGAAGVLLVAGALLLRSYAGLVSRDPGLDPATLVAVPSLRGGYDDLRARDAFLTQVADRLAAVPGVFATSWADAGPLGGHSNVPLDIDGEPPDPVRETDRVLVGPGYFEGLGATLLTGRSLDASDREDAVRVAVVNETFARAFLPGGALGRRVRQGPDDPEWRTVVGVVADIRQQGPFAAVEPHLYLPMNQVPEPGPVSLLVRPASGAAPLQEAIRRAVRDVDPSVPLASVESVRDRFARELSAPRLHLALMAIFAATALALALIGVFGVVSQRVRARRREMAIRLTLGAEGSALARGIVAEGMRLGAAGLLLGLAGSLAVSGIVGRFLFGVSARDPISFCAIAFLLLGTTALAAWLPARHTVRLNPSESLRGD